MVARITIVGNKNLFCRITSGCCSNLARNRKVVAILGRVVVESSSSFCKKISVHVYAAHFTGPVETCFAATDVNPLYGMTQSNYESLFTQLIFLNMHLILSVSSRLICFIFFEDMIYIIFCLFFVDRVL